MRTVLCCVIALAVELVGQSSRNGRTVVNEMDATLLAVKTSATPRASLSRQLADEVMSLAEANHRPSRATVVRFVNDLIGALTAANQVTPDQAVELGQRIRDGLRGSEPNAESARHLSDDLTALHVSASNTQVICKDFIAIGEQVRGPDDLPLQQ